MPSACLAQSPGATATTPFCDPLSSRHPCPGGIDGRQNMGQPQDTRLVFSGKGLSELGSPRDKVCARRLPTCAPGHLRRPFSIAGCPAPKGGERHPWPLPTRGHWQPHSNCDDQNCLQTVPRVPRWDKRASRTPGGEGLNLHCTFPTPPAGHTQQSVAPPHPSNAQTPLDGSQAHS